MQSLTIRDAATFLNELLAYDRDAVDLLIEARVPTAGLEAHPSVTVRGAASGGLEVGLLGILNGLFGGGDHLITSRYESDTLRLIDFEVVETSSIYPEQES